MCFRSAGSDEVVNLQTESLAWMEASDSPIPWRITLESRCDRRDHLGRVARRLRCTIDGVTASRLDDRCANDQHCPCRADVSRDHDAWSRETSARQGQCW